MRFICADYALVSPRHSVCTTAVRVTPDDCFVAGFGTADSVWAIWKNRLHTRPERVPHRRTSTEACPVPTEMDAFVDASPSTCAFVGSKR
eukprot:gene22119-biopygen11714